MARKKARGEDESESADSGSENAESIESAMQELAGIVSMLESGQGTLDESLAQFERGTSLLRSCHRQLDAAAQRIEIVTRTAENGEMVTAEFEAGATHQRPDSSRSRNKKADEAADDESESGRSLF